MGRVVAFVNEKGGAGKTTAVVECAYHAGANGKTVVVVDLDPQGNATSMLTGRSDHRPTIFDMFVDREGKVSLADVAVDALEAWPHVLVLPSSGALSTVDSHLGSRPGKERILARLLQPIRSTFDLILIDLGPAADFLTLNALVAADAFHVPADLSTYTLSGIQTITEFAKDVVDSGANASLRFGGVFLSGYHKAHSRGVRGLEESLRTLVGATAVDIKVPHSSRVIESQAQNKPVGVIDPEGKVSQSYRLLTERLFQ